MIGGGEFFSLKFWTSPTFGGVTKEVDSFASGSANTDFVSTGSGSRTLSGTAAFTVSNSQLGNIDAL